MSFSSASPRILLTIVIGLMPISAAPVYGQGLPDGVRAVDITSTAPGGGDGLSWETAYGSLADALDEALAPQPDPAFEPPITEIWVADTPNGQAYRPDQDHDNGPLPKPRAELSHRDI